MVFLLGVGACLLVAGLALEVRTSRTKIADNAPRTMWLSGTILLTILALLVIFGR